jgi:hypothetical protein
MPVFVRVGGTWRTASSVYTRIGGTWRTASDMPVKVGGVWKTGVLVQNSFESIATFTPSGVGTVTFSSIPNTYKSLQVRISCLTSSNGNVVLGRFNSDTNTSYDNHYMGGRAQGGFNYGVLNNRTEMYLSDITAASSTTFPMVSIVDVVDYASTSKNKTVKVISGADRNLTNVGGLLVGSNLWRSTSAVNSFTVYLSGGTFSAGTTIALYGMK